MSIPIAGLDGLPLLKKRCGTCIDRKISCDRRHPRCSNCVRSNRACQGYGLRLSWPRDNDRKRMIVSRAGYFLRRSRHNSPSSGQFHMINATSWDIKVYQYLNTPHGNPIPALSHSLSRSMPGLSATEKDLFQFFQNKVAVGLSSFSSKPLGQSLLRLASSGDSLASVALQRSLIAVAYQYRYGPGLRGEELKLSAIHALAASAAQGIQSQSAVQHVAAGMVLCLFETRQSSVSSNQWLCYLRAAGKVIESVSLKSFVGVTDGPILLEWVYYHEVLARFSLRHWRRSDGEVPSHACFAKLPCYLPEEKSRWHAASGIVQWQKPIEHQKLFEPLHLLSEVTAEILPSKNPTCHGEEYKVKIKNLKEEIMNLKGPRPFDDETRRAAAKAEVFRIATLVYLSRSTGQDSTHPSEIPLLVKRGLHLIHHMGICERPLPLLILGCEARTDIERLYILDLVASTETAAPDRHLHSIKTLLQALWTQDDLHAEDNVQPDYMEKLSAVFTASRLLPHFA
ncbi:zinc-finger transcription factor [Colletotrichum tofieldiae]|uniref:Zinc-finger transcription factor n=1 Tax=Colletotrichum tofieldiae TaxID=708197 RepID=A0A166VAL6_9PEZI|nr:zinc-finger transcription factor [Colletotrichum tofieldiae]